jgi:two-component system response regulator AdeR
VAVVKKIILVVDDEPEIAESIQDELLRHSYEVIVAHSFSDALTNTEGKSPDLIITDIRMPKGNGYELIKAIRARRNSGVPIIVLTGNDTDKERLESEKIGVDCFMTKPFDIKELTAKVAELLGL